MTEVFNTRFRESTNLWFRTSIDPMRGVQVECTQDLRDTLPGPTVTIGRGANGWEVSVRFHNGDRVRIVDNDGRPLVSLCGDVPTFRDLFDDEADVWEE